MKTLRKKTTATLLITIFIMSTMAFAVSASSGIELITGGTGVAEWTTEEVHSGSYSVKLLLPLPTINEIDMAQVVFDYGKPLNELDSVSFYGLLEDSLAGAVSYSRPRIFLEIDTNGDGIYSYGDNEYGPGIDARIEQKMYPEWTELDTWYSDNMDNDGDGNSHIQVFGDRTGLVTGATPKIGWYVQTMSDPLHAYLGQLKLETYSGDIKWGDLTVLRIKVGIGGWTGPKDGTVIAFIDDITINGISYDLEPTKADLVPGKGKGIDDAPGLDKAPPNDNFGGRNRSNHGHGKE